MQTQQDLDNFQTRDALLSLTRLSTIFDTEVRSLVIDVATIRAELKALAEQQQQLNKTVIQGNGRESLMATVVRIDERAQKIAQEYRDFQQDMDNRLNQIGTGNLTEMQAIRRDLDSLRASFADFQKTLTKNDGNTTVQVKQSIDWGDGKVKVITVAIGAIVTLMTTLIPFLVARDTAENSIPTIVQPVETPESEAP